MVKWSNHRTNATGVTLARDLAPSSRQGNARARGCTQEASAATVAAPRGLQPALLWRTVKSAP